MCVCVSIYQEDLLEKVRHHLTKSEHHYKLDILTVETLLQQCAVGDSISYDGTVPSVTHVWGDICSLSVIFASKVSATLSLLSCSRIGSS
jgi:riboflavin synthase alpha subunit